MSVVLDATYEGETFEVEVFHDGHIEFPDRDLEYEQAMAEFTSTESAVTKFYASWNWVEQSKTAVIFATFRDPPVTYMLRLAVDCIKRVIHFCDEYGYKGAKNVKGVIEILSVSMEKGLDLEAIEAAVKTDTKSISRIRSLVSLEEKNENTSAFTSPGAVAAATEWLVSAIESRHSDDLIARRMLSWGVSLAAEAVAADAAFAAVEDVPFEVDIDTDSSEWRQAYAAEAAWQLRRFVDVMEAVGQGLPWPPIEATP